ncbi:hypothetical protein Tco_0199296 [Tanacetum coccineum]
MRSSTRWQNLTSPNAFHWLIPSREDTLDDEKAQERWDFTLLTLTKKEQGVSITDCHAGNPCEISSDLTDENDLPMIGRLYGYDQEERVTEMRTRRIDHLGLLHLCFAHLPNTPAGTKAVTTAYLFICI